MYLTGEYEIPLARSTDKGIVHAKRLSARLRIDSDAGWEVSFYVLLGAKVGGKEHEFSQLSSAVRFYEER